MFRVIHTDARGVITFRSWSQLDGFTWQPFRSKAQTYTLDEAQRLVQEFSKYLESGTSLAIFCEEKT